MECGIKIFLFILFEISLVGSFSWKDCGNSAELIKVTSLDVYTNQTKIIYVSGKAKVATTIEKPIRARVDMKKKFFWGWTEIPCIDNLGSCEYDDICESDPYKDKPCPAEFTANNIPCKCPIPQGQFQGKKLPIDLNLLPHWLEKGKYRIQLTLYKEQTELMCIIMYINI